MDMLPTMLSIPLNLLLPWPQPDRRIPLCPPFFPTQVLWSGALPFLKSFVMFPLLSSLPYVNTRLPPDWTFRVMVRTPAETFFLPPFLFIFSSLPHPRTFSHGFVSLTPRRNFFQRELPSSPLLEEIEESSRFARGASYSLPPPLCSLLSSRAFAKSVITTSQ